MNNKKLLIDASHPEETRVALLHGKILEEFDSETQSRRSNKGNIYLAKVVRVEPALQAAFVEFGGQRQGFVPFGEIHPSYYQIPVSDRATLIPSPSAEPLSEIPLEDNVETIEEEVKQAPRPPRYRIQEVIKRRQVLLVQVNKEERGSKGASLTTYLSFPGRYCVLMPNAGHRSGGVSRKIESDDDRKRLRELMRDLELPEGMSIIVRTAGQERTKTEIKRDCQYLLRLWDEIRENALKSEAPALIYEEEDLVKKAIRDMYTREVDEIWVSGETAYREARVFMKALTPSHAKKIQYYRNPTLPLFQMYNIEEKIDAISEPRVYLPSGGSLVITQTEALVSIDVNSGRATRERHIDETALKTNLEAAEEVARQMRLRDLSGLIVIDFIDMSDHHHIHQVERKFRDAVKIDRARIQLGRISQFGLFELSRQRLRPSFLETHTTVCSHCQGRGVLRSTESTALYILRRIESEIYQHREWGDLLVSVPAGIDLYLLNEKRSSIRSLEDRFAVNVHIVRDHGLISTHYHIQVLSEKKPEDILPFKPVAMETIVSPVSPLLEEPVLTSVPTSSPVPTESFVRKRRRPRRDKPTQEKQDLAIPPLPSPDENPLVEESALEKQRPRRRRRRGPRPVTPLEQNATESLPSHEESPRPPKKQGWFDRILGKNDEE